jgi:hypothetical protein
MLLSIIKRILNFFEMLNLEMRSFVFVKLTTDLYLVPRSKNAQSYTSTHPIRLHGVVLS